MPRTVLYVMMLLPLLWGLTQTPTTPLQAYTGTPSYVNVAKPLPVTTAGPTAPVIVAPGSCFNLVLGEDINASTGYMWRVVENEGKLSVENYTVIVNMLEHGNLKICIPPDITEGLYDFELVGLTNYSTPRSIWVLEKVPRRVRIAVMSDLHFGAGPQTLLDGDICRFSAAFLTSSLNPTFVIWAGDISDSASEGETIQAQVYRYLFLYKYPVLGVPGNHDNPGSFYAKYLGPVRWVRLLGDKLLLIGIYTNPYREGGIGAWEEISFLEEALRNFSYIPLKIIVFHYPMFYYQGEVVARYDDEETLKPYEPGVETPVSSYWSSNMTSFRYVLKLIEDYNVTVVVSGHVHRDQFVKYTSTRTNTTTYFITVTAAGMGAATYQGVTFFELNTETGELSFPVAPPTFIGFKYSSSRLSSNSIPVRSLQTKLVKSSVFYKLEVKNTVSWLNVNTTLIMALPWNQDLAFEFKNYTSSPNSSITVLGHLIVKDMLYLSVRLYLGFGAVGELMITGSDDTSPPVILLKRYIPATPIINRTLTIYIGVVDTEWGVNVDSILIKFNGTSISVKYAPETLMADFNTITLTITLSLKAEGTTLTVLEVYVRDYYGRDASKKFRILFYPPSVKPTETPVEEIVEVAETPTTTSTVEMSTETTTTTPSMVTTFTTQTTTFTPPVPTLTTTTPLQSIPPLTESTPSQTTMQPETIPPPPKGVNLVIVIILTAIVLVTAFLSLRRKKYI